MNRIAFVVTCKGRLHHLRQSLPLLTRQPDSECIVVDYDCPDHSHLWVSEHFPQVRVIHVKDSSLFNISHARNLGAQNTTAPWLCFVDADILVAEDFAEKLTPALRDGFYYRPLPISWEKWGTHLCARGDFQRVEGYDEVMQGWGGEDNDLYRRLEELGCRPAGFPGDLVSSIQHGNEERTRHYEIRDRWVNQRINAFYLQIKYDVARHMKTTSLPPASRQTIYAEVRRSLLRDIAQGAAISRFEVALPDHGEVRLTPGWTLRRRVVYEMTPQVGLVPESLATKEIIDDYFAAHAVRKLHLGCGDNLLKGWLNTDLQPRKPGILQLDATRSLPFPRDSFEYVFSEHLVEHMPYPQGCRLLAECNRILKPGGVLRMATPDLAFLVGLYKPDKSDLQQAFLDWSKEHFLPWAPNAEDTFVINNAMRDWGHQFIYDDKVMRRALAEAGFANIERCKLMESQIVDLCQLENEARKPPGLLAVETLVFEATKA
ncbi:MAG: glycosyltransferase [Burkholderiaceae bacterium]|nr:glycosyltransferase [Burkholderiaceae bacterium]